MIEKIRNTFLTLRRMPILRACKLAEIALQNDSPESARSYLAPFVTKKRSSHPQPLFLMAMVCEKSGDFEQAITFYRKALYLTSYSPGAESDLRRVTCRLAQQALQNHVPERAKTYLESFMEGRSPDLQVLTLMGKTHERLRNFEQAARFYKKALYLNGNAVAPTRGLARVDARLQEREQRAIFSDLIERIEDAIKAGNFVQAIAEADQFKSYKDWAQNLSWWDDELYAKAAYFTFQEDIKAAVENYDPELITMSVEYGYLSWPRRIQNFILNKSVLDVGCGFGGYGIGFLVAGARSYTGLDPAMDLDSNKAKNKRTRSIALMPKTPRQIMNSISQIRLIQGKSEDVAHQGQYDVISLHNVTEHLMDIDQVLKGFLPLMRKETKIVFLHHHFFCWNGHHMAPARLEDFDEANEAHRKYADWAHVIHGNAYPENDYIKTGLNQISLATLKKTVERYFQLLVWEEGCSDDEVLKRLTPALADKALAARPGISRKDLETRLVFCVAERII